MEPGQSVPGADLFLALLREAVEGDVRRRAGVGARHAVVVSADAVRAAASRSAARRLPSPASSARWWCCRAATSPARRKTILLMLTLAATLPLLIAMVKRPALYNGIRHFIFVIPPMTVLAGTRLRMGNELARRKPPQLAARRRGGLRVRPAVAARRDDPAAPLSVHPLQSHRRHGARRRRSLHAGLLGPRAEAGLRRPARAARRTAGSAAARDANGRSRCAARSARRRSRSAPTSRSAGTATPPTSR